MRSVQKCTYCGSIVKEQESMIEQTVQDIFDICTKYSDCSLADFYDETTMLPELRKAH